MRFAFFFLRLAGFLVTGAGCSVFMLGAFMANKFILGCMFAWMTFCVAWAIAHDDWKSIHE